MRLAISMSNVAATLLAAGKQAAFVPPVKSAPRAPLGPSEVYVLLVCMIPFSGRRYIP